MANELTYPMLPCGDIDEAIAFYEALGFKKTYRQLRPNPCAVIQREDWQMHLFGMPNFNPADSYGSVIVVVPDPDALYQAFVAGLRAKFGKLPAAGIPRILRPRKKFGTVSGFSVVDVGGNWLRIYKLGATDEAAEAEESSEVDGLTHFINVAARLADAAGDEKKAIRTLESGLKKYPAAEPMEIARALLYHAELAVRLNRKKVAEESLERVVGLKLSKSERKCLAEEIKHVETLISEA
ncbi:bleomycin resistance protein [Anatilimnocola floriformis]|uniref:bleomycin resistance protein n=1 Tax=Anatilimnocola floriformis TaxID=2948575 RepID=UPI0020C3BC52|nr:VOC family protein [Anatilimnocola floriformis]